jgi:hypothetical protein
MAELKKGLVKMPRGLELPLPLMALIHHHHHQNNSNRYCAKHYANHIK